MTAEPFISLRNVRKVYRSAEQEFLAVSDVTMDVQEGELISLVGPSGCGKTTVLKILAGLHGADGGTVKIGNATTPFDPARDIAAITVNRWPHGYAYLFNTLYSSEPDGPMPYEIARARFGDVTIANSDADWDAFFHVAIDQAYRAVQDLQQT